jgi:aryl-alcohol dehydrogenase-like predicted oxidoreductase
MEKITIGSSDLKTSRIGLGTWAIGGWMWGGSNEAESIATIRSAIERGVTLIDTAPAYGFGRSEEIVGKALAEGGLRDKVTIATKVGLAWTARSFATLVLLASARRSTIHCGGCAPMS